MTLLQMICCSFNVKVSWGNPQCAREWACEGNPLLYLKKKMKSCLTGHDVQTSFPKLVQFGHKFLANNSRHLGSSFKYLFRTSKIGRNLWGLSRTWCSYKYFFAINHSLNAFFVSTFKWRLHIAKKIINCSGKS